MGGEWDEATVPEVARVAGVERFTILELTRHLERAGFAVESYRYTTGRGRPSSMGLFVTTRR